MDINRRPRKKVDIKPSNKSSDEGWEWLPDMRLTILLIVIILLVYNCEHSDFSRQGEEIFVFLFELVTVIGCLVGCVVLIGTIIGKTVGRVKEKIAQRKDWTICPICHTSQIIRKQDIFKNIICVKCYKSFRLMPDMVFAPTNNPGRHHIEQLPSTTFSLEQTGRQSANTTATTGDSLSRGNVLPSNSRIQTNAGTPNKQDRSTHSSPDIGSANTYICDLMYIMGYDPTLRPVPKTVEESYRFITALIGQSTILASTTLKQHIISISRRDENTTQTFYRRTFALFDQEKLCSPKQNAFEELMDEYEKAKQC